MKGKNGVVWLSRNSQLLFVELMREGRTSTTVSDTFGEGKIENVESMRSGAS